MPMNSVDEHAMGDVARNYCRYCARPDGSMQSFDEKLESMTQFIVKTQGLDAIAARETAKRTMLKLPAWKTNA
jgi:hypothetical protein